VDEPKATRKKGGARKVVKITMIIRGESSATTVARTGSGAMKAAIPPLKGESIWGKIIGLKE
jgi:hypothetical protein